MAVSKKEEFTQEEIKEECYKILGKKLANSKNFSADKKEVKANKINLDENNSKEKVENESYLDLFEQYGYKINK